MTARNAIPTAAPPSLATLANTTAISLVVAGVLLVAFVLPAEYAIDPLGVGRALGLTEIASPTLRPVEMQRVDGALLAPVQKGAVGEYPAPFAYDVRDITLDPYDFVEYKYQLEQGATMFYAWEATAPVSHDFHGERAGGAGADGPAEESFDNADRRSATGSLIAPFAGIHGWFWENPSGDPITIRLTTSGFYSAAVEIRSDRTRHPRVLRALDTLPREPAAPAPLNPR